MSQSSSGRFTPKKSSADKAAASPGATATPDAAKAAKAPAYKSTGRYTPPVVHAERQPSPMWVPILMFTLLILGLFTIVGNYMNLLPGDTSNGYLVLGLAFIVGGFVTATQLR